AHDKGTGREQKITITASSGLSREEVEKMQREGEMHAAEDTKRREEVEAKNMADTLAYTAEKTLREQKDKIPEDLNKEVESKVATVRSALQGTDIDALRKATQELSEAMQKVGSAVYQQQPPPPGAEPPPEGEPPAGEEGGGEEGTVEGEFREV
ncbi:MAG TPA: Hsp70 family protein, partial [Dehalococcoidales bacterium]|nr:Hsp70 family protein [Dehalococcoidales bacterium]